MDRLLKILICFFLGVISLSALTACGGGGDSAATNPAGTPTNSDCVIDQSPLGSCTLG